MRRRRHRYRARTVPRARVGLSVLALLAGMILGPVGATTGVRAAPEPADRAGAPTGATPVRPGTPGPDRSTVPPADRAAVLPAGWATSADVITTTVGDSGGLRLLVAESRTGYTWRTAAVLAEPGFDTDQWIGNVCLTGSGRRAVVVYAPRQFTNREQLFQRGGFVAVVELATGRVTKLPVTVSIAYHNPGCGVAEQVALTQSGFADRGRTRVYLLDAAAGRLVRRHEVGGQLTSSVPVGTGIVAASAGGLVSIDPTGRRRELAGTGGVPFAIRAGADGGVAFLQTRGRNEVVARYAAGGRLRDLAHGPLGRFGLAAGTGGRIFLTGTPTRTATLPATVRRVAADPRAGISSHGVLALTHQPRPVTEPSVRGEPGTAGPVALRASVTATGATVDFEVPPNARTSAAVGQGRKAGPAGRAAGATRGRTGIRANGYDGRFNPIDDDRTCAVPRNDARTQVYQPYWRQVEWAVDQAVFGRLTTPRPANWHQSGLPSWSPQGMYPRPVLAADTPDARVPAQVMLGILAQESNLWQASSLALEGEYGNPLIGNFYGRDIYDEDTGDDWVIRWNKADCGYGVAQVTTGMRWNDTTRTNYQKRAIAVDYATNIAAALDILGDKWNHARQLGIIINNGDPARPENWFAALWAYNTGMQPRDAETGNTTGCRAGPSCHDGRGNFGLGWANNPINPEYRPDRDPFLNGPDGDGRADDARHPQDWPYPEKVLGWAAFPIIKTDPFAGTYQAGYRQAWWSTERYRSQVKPPRDLFCSSANHCDPDRAAPCLESDLHCWWHEPAEWKPGCREEVEPGVYVGTCGNEGIRYDPGWAEPADFNEWYRPNCAGDGSPDAPPGSWVIDDVYDSIPSARPCADPSDNSGTFSLEFAEDETGHYRSKVDFHQVGAGYGGHFWSSHTRRADDPTMRVTGTWTLNHQYHGWARVLVHVPDHGSHTGQAAYQVLLGDGSGQRRIVNQKSYRLRSNGHRWVPLGVFQFAGTPGVMLSNVTGDGTGDNGITWDAVAFQPLSAKPRHFVVALGDSFSSGEGASADGGVDYYPETDVDGDYDARRNNCHRSRQSWLRKASLRDMPTIPVGQRADDYAEALSLDYHMLACSGAETENLLPAGVSNDFGEPGRGSDGEVSQLEAGFLDSNTTLVTLSVGGNDSRFGPVIEHCLVTVNTDCQDTVLPGDSVTLGQAEDALIRGPVRRSIRTVLTEIHRRAPNAKIILMGYPHLVANQGSCLRGLTVPNPWTGGPALLQIGLSELEASWMNITGDLLANVMTWLTEDAAEQEDIRVWYADPRPQFAGRGVCGTPEDIHGLVTGLTRGEKPLVEWARLGLSQQSFHPKTTGTTRYADTLVTTLRRPEVNE